MLERESAMHRMASCRCSRLTCKFGTAHRQVRACMPRFPHQIFRASKFGRASKGYATTAPSRVPFPVSVLRALSLFSCSLSLNACSLSPMTAKAAGPLHLVRVRHCSLSARAVSQDVVVWAATSCHGQAYRAVRPGRDDEGA